MKLIFYGNQKGNWIDKLIRWWTSPLSWKLNGDWKYAPSHVEILFSDGLMFSASGRENKARFKKHNPKGKAWIRVPSETDRASEAIVRLFCTSLAGRSYDYAGVSGFALPIKQDKRKWFCSEITTRALQQLDISELKCLVPHKTSPLDLLLATGAEFDSKFKEWKIKPLKVLNELGS